MTAETRSSTPASLAPEYTSLASVHATPTGAAADLAAAQAELVAASVTGRTPLGALRDGWDLARELSRRGDWATPPPSSSPSARCPSDIATAGRDACPRSAGARMAQSCRSAAEYTTSHVVDVAHPTVPDARTVGVAS